MDDQSERKCSPGSGKNESSEQTKQKSIETSSLPCEEIVFTSEIDNIDRKPPPEAAKTPFMCFSSYKEKLAMKENIQNGMASGDNIRKLAEEWKKLPRDERLIWEEEARKDKIRFAEEKASYHGNWDLPKRRAKKHPLAPKRPMSAFLKFSQTRRKVVKSQNPYMSNTDVSRLLGEMWRNASPSEKNPYIDEELRERSIYKAEIAKFRSEQAKREAFKMEFERRSMMDHPLKEDDAYNEGKPFPRQNEFSSTGFDYNRHSYDWENLNSWPSEPAPMYTHRRPSSGQNLPYYHQMEQYPYGPGDPHTQSYSRYPSNHFHSRYNYPPDENFGNSKSENILYDSSKTYPQHPHNHGNDFDRYYR